MVSEAEFISTIEKIKKFHNNAFVLIDNAVRCEENDTPLDAINKYKEGIEIIDEALATPVGLPDNIDDVKEEWNSACKMIHKLKRARAEVVQRIGVLNQKYGSAIVNANEILESSPERNDITYDHLQNGRPRTYTELAQALREMQFISNGISSLELLYSCDGVKVYFIKANGEVTTTSDNSILRIIRLEKDERKLLDTTFFIQIIKSDRVVQLKEINSNTASTSSNEINQSEELKDNFDGKDNSSWIYPLIPGVSPCFRTDYGAFIFPNLETLSIDENDSSYGLVVPNVNSADEIVLEILEAILHGVVDSKKRITRSEPPRDISTKVSENIVRGASCISKNIIKGASKAGEMLNYSTPYLISKIKPAPPNPEPFSNKVNTSVEVAKSVTGAAAGLTVYIADKVGSATMCLGRFMAPHIQKHGSTLLSKGFGLTEEDASNKMTGVLTVAAGAVEGFGTIYCGLEDAANILGKNLSNNSVKIIEHKYGTSAGNVASGTFDTVGNVINVSRNINYITPKGIVKKTAKNAGKAIVEDFRPLRNTGQNFIPAAAIYPNLNSLENQIKK